MWRLAGTVIVIEGLVMLGALAVALSNYDDDLPEGGPTTATAFNVFEVAGLVLIATVAVMFVIVAVTHRRRGEPENPPLDQNP